MSNGKILSGEEFNEIAIRYKNNESVTTLAKEYGVERSTINKNLRRLGISCNATVRSKIKELHDKGYSSIEIKKTTGKSYRHVMDSLNKMNLKTHKKWSRQRHSLDDDFFSNIENEKQAYFLGLLCADGAIINSDNRNAIAIALQERDGYLIEEFKEAIQATNKISRWEPAKSTHQAKIAIQIQSKKMIEDLNKLGCTSKKSLTMKMPKLKDNILWHFIRGYFDGDGCFTIGSIKLKEKIRLRLHCFMCGSKDFCESLNDILNNKFGIRSVVRKPKNNQIYLLRIENTSGVKKFGEFMYHDANVFMTRKKEKFNTWQLSLQ